MIIALHNIAVEYEYLKQYQSALMTYQKARDFAFKFLGPAHIFSQKMDKVLDESARKIKGIVERQSKRLGAKYANPHIQSNKATVGLAKHAHSKSTISATGAEEATDLSQLLESGLSLETA